MQMLAPHRQAGTLPNWLTFARIIAAPAVIACLYLDPAGPLRLIATVLFVAACVTDWLDGYLARIWQQQSALGRMLDPIADKLLVGATLLMLVADRTLVGLSVLAAAIILCREILVSGLREFLAELSVKVHVTHLAKIKTGLQMAALTALLGGPAVGAQIMTSGGLVLLWLAAALTLWTGYDYLKAGIATALER